MDEVETEIRAEFEEILERDHGVSGKEDRELLNGLWVNLDDEDKFYARSDLKTGVQDLVLEAVGSRLYQNYMGFKRGKALPSSAWTTTRDENVDSSTTRD